MNNTLKPNIKYSSGHYFKASMIFDARFLTYNLQGGKVMSNSMFCIFSDKCLRGLIITFEPYHHFQLGPIVLIISQTERSNPFLGIFCEHIFASWSWFCNILWKKKSGHGNVPESIPTMSGTSNILNVARSVMLNWTF